MTNGSSDDEWNLSKERAFIEDILCQRFNFLLVFYSLILAGAFTAASPRYVSLALTLGTCITLPLAVTIARVQHRLDCIIEHLDKQHPAEMTKGWTREKEPPLIWRFFAKESKRQWIGYWIPLLLALSLLLGACLAWIEVLKGA
jgi:hypothetical protein